MTSNQPPGAVSGNPVAGPVARLHPPAVLAFIRAAVPWLMGCAATVSAIGFLITFWIEPAESGRSVLSRIAYIHVPAIWVSLALYALLVFWSGVRLLTGMRLASMMLEAIAPTGALFALLVLWTGSLWSMAVHDTWWNWDARHFVDLTMLTFFGACAMAPEVVDENARADTAAAALVLFGGAVLAVALYSVDVVPGRAEPATGAADRTGDRALVALLLVSAGFAAYATAAALKRLRCVLLERERASPWVARWNRSA